MSAELFNELPFNLAGEVLRAEIDTEGARRLEAENKANERKAQLNLGESKSKTRWLCKFMRKGMEPPYPFGKTNMVVAARTREEAVRILKQSGMVSGYTKVTASRTDLETSYHFKHTDDPTYVF